MPNTVSAAYKQVQPNRTQAYLRYKMVSDVIAKAEFGQVTPAQTIKFPYGNSVKVQDYGYQSGNSRTDMTLVADSYTIDQAKSAVMGYDKIQNLQIQNPSWVADIEAEMGQQLARNVDQYVINKGVTSAFGTYAGGALSSSNMLATLATGSAILEEQLAMPGMQYALMDPLKAALLPQMDALLGFTKSDDALTVGANGFQGKESVGFKVLVSNNLPYSNTLTLSTNPSAGHTLVVGGYTWTFVANGTATNPGEISIGGSAAATQAIVKDALNGAGSPGASTYIEPASEDRIYMQNSQLTCGSFNTNVATVTKYGRINGSITVAGANAFGTETTVMLLGIAGAIDMTMLQAPYFEELPANAGTGKVTHAKDMIMTTLFGAGVWQRKARSLLKVTCNA